MKLFAQIFISILVINNGLTKPIAGINIKKNFEIEFNPKPLKSLEFIIEKWTRFGRFGLKHKIEKRDTNDVVDSSQLTVEQDGLNVLPVKIESVTILPLLQSTKKSSTNLVENIIMIPVVEPSNEESTPIKPFLSVSSAPNIESSVPIETTILQSSTTALPPISINLDVKSLSPPGLYTNILQSLNVPQINEVDRPIAENLPIPNLENTNFIIRGSKFAMYFGSMLLRILSQYLSGSRISFANFPGQDVSL